MIMAAESIGTEQYLTFRMAGEEYAIGILQVREILRYETLTRVPAAPPSIRGVLNLRGSVVPVVDLALKFGMGETVVNARTCIVIVEAELEGRPTTLGVLADAVSQVIDLPASEIEPPPHFGTRVRSEYLRGLARLGERFALVLEIDRVLSAEVLLPPEAAEAAAEGGAAPAAEEPSAAGGLS